MSQGIEFLRSISRLKLRHNCGKS